jgi:hypothetical protein
MFAERNKRGLEAAVAGKDSIALRHRQLFCDDDERVFGALREKKSIVNLSPACIDDSRNEVKRDSCCSDQSDAATASTAECSVSSGDNFANIAAIDSSCNTRRSILRAESKISDPQDRDRAANSTKKKRSVRFSTVLVRDYSIILGDHPCCSYGPPLTIDWEYHENKPLQVDEYEGENALIRRSLPELVLNNYQRRYLLQDYNELDLKAVMREVNRIKSNRYTSKLLAKCHTVEAALECARRKIKRISLK